MKTIHPLPILVLAAPFFLSACGSGPGDEVQVQKTSASRSSMQAAAAVTIFAGSLSDYVIAKTATGFTITSKSNSQATTVPANARLRFDDVSVALDIEGTTGKAYRLYRAAFARTPDLLGLSYWIAMMDNGASADSVAIEFARSPEFKTAYGATPTNTEIVARFYQNVLGRQGEPDGAAYWQGVLDARTATVAQVLYGFSESAENKEAVLAAIQLGIAYNEPGVTYTPGSLIDPMPYSGQAMATTKAQADALLNGRGANGYAYIGPMVSLAPAWSMDLFIKGASGESFKYGFVNAGGVSAAARLAAMEAEGKKGYLFKSTVIYGTDIANMYDMYVKSSIRNTTYSYRMKAEGFSLESLQANGAQGYAYRGQIFIDNVTQSLYVKDNTANATYDYKTSNLQSLSSGLLATMNELGAQSYAYQGAMFTGTEMLSLFVRSSANSAPYSYTTAPRTAGSLQETVDGHNERALKGERYYGDLMDGPTAVSVYYKGPWIVHPLAGPTFP